MPEAHTATNPETSPTHPATATIAEVVVENRIHASPEVVWRAMTDEIGEWWPNDFYAGGQPGQRSFRFEAEPGGRMYETWEGGGGLLWATVCTVDPGRMLQLSGLTFANWGGPSTWMGTWEIRAEGDTTVLRFTEHTLGQIGAGHTASKAKGWEFLFGGALKAHVEGTEPPAWAD